MMDEYDGTALPLDGLLDDDGAGAADDDDGADGADGAGGTQAEAVPRATAEAQRPPGAAEEFTTPDAVDATAVLTCCYY